MTREIFDRQRERWAYLRRSDKLNKKLVIFVHGFRGSYLSTWGDLANFLKQHADNDKDLKSWDYLFVGYATHSIDTYLGIADIIGSQWKKASNRAPPFDRNEYSQVALFGRSLGTLGVRQLLCAVSEQPTNKTTALTRAVLFGSPLNGSPLAGIAGLAALWDGVTGSPAALRPGSYRINRALEKGNAELRMLQVWSKTVRGLCNGRFGPTKVILGADDQVVGTGELAEWGDDDKLMTAMGHSSMVKVTNTGASTQGTVLDELRSLG